jgi:hypothetical protein
MILDRCDEATDFDRILEETIRAKQQWALGVVESIVRFHGQTGRAKERGSRGQ